MSARILVLPGSVRTGSLNALLAAEAARRLALTSASVTLLSLADYPLPLLDADLEASDGLPENAVKLAERIAAQDALLLVSPEYNASLPPLLKNAVDWMSRVTRIGGRPVQPFRRLIVGFAAASPRPGGGARSLAAWRLVFQDLGADLLTPQCTVGEAGTAFDESGRLSSERANLALDTLVETLVGQASALGRHGF
ncbi:NADPH-dependent FMN reductase [Mangrovibrevibacter kandeliae]|uniref:NADPH-dependent FMN reductase n=1 Tax=Mangrovibrevibacter kandeliae TaxID=2968473 RepID=UPI0021197FBE|nr:NAD(P)H-dependent oxidoreductase [Aurantimonas sp. CSK15Z-1]